MGFRVLVDDPISEGPFLGPDNSSHGELTDLYWEAARWTSSMRVPQGSVLYVCAMLVASFLLTGSSSLVPSASIFLTKECRSLTSKPMWSSTRPLVGACAVSALANRSWAPGISTTGALLRVPAFPPNVFTYQD